MWFLGEDAVEEEGQTFVPNELPKTASGKIQKHILRSWSRKLASRDIGRVPSTSGNGGWPNGPSSGRNM